MSASEKQYNSSMVVNFRVAEIAMEYQTEIMFQWHALVVSTSSVICTLYK